MFSFPHYVPILIGKLGEYRALNALSGEDKQKLTPLIDVPFLPWDHKNRKFARSYEQHLGTVANWIERSWGSNRCIFLDLYYVQEGETVGDGRHPLTYLLDDARARQIRIVPVTGLDRSGDYQDALIKAVSVDSKGFCVRLSSEDLANVEELRVALITLVNRASITPEFVDLIIDFRNLPIEDVMRKAREATNTIKRLPHIQRWRTLTCIAPGFLDTDDSNHAVLESYAAALA